MQKKKAGLNLEIAFRFMKGLGGSFGVAWGVARWVAGVSPGDDAFENKGIFEDIRP